VCLVLLAVALVVLLASGVWLWFNYRPTSLWVRDLHRITSVVVAWLALATVVLLIGRRIRTGSRGVVAGLTVGATAFAASFTGFLLPWDQLALWAVTVGSNTFDGVQTTFESRVKYVLIGSREVSMGTYRFWAITHVVLGVLVAATLVLAWLRTGEPAPVTHDSDLVAAP
jgi:quinol-cytochrome oxidoreductase complex cytochrome b subunit